MFCCGEIYDCGDDVINVGDNLRFCGDIIGNGGIFLWCVVEPAMPGNAPGTQGPAEIGGI